MISPSAHVKQIGITKVNQYGNSAKEVKEKRKNAQGMEVLLGSKVLCFVLKFSLPPFSPPLPSGVQISKQNAQGTLDPINDSTPAQKVEMSSLLLLSPLLPLIKGSD